MDQISLRNLGGNYSNLRKERNHEDFKWKSSAMSALTETFVPSLMNLHVVFLSFAGRDSWEPCNKVNVMLWHFDNLFLKCCYLYCFSPFSIPVFFDLTESYWLQSKERELCVVFLKRERLIPESNSVTNCSTNCEPESRLVSEREGGFSVKLSPEITAVPAATLIPVLWETCYHRNPAKSRLNLWFSVTRMTNTACGKRDVKASFGLLVQIWWICLMPLMSELS